MSQVSTVRRGRIVGPRRVVVVPTRIVMPPAACVVPAGVVVKWWRRVRTRSAFNSLLPREARPVQQALRRLLQVIQAPERPPGEARVEGSGIAVVPAWRDSAASSPAAPSAGGAWGTGSPVMVVVVPVVVGRGGSPRRRARCGRVLVVAAAPLRVLGISAGALVRIPGIHGVAPWTAWITAGAVGISGMVGMTRVMIVRVLIVPVSGIIVVRIAIARVVVVV